VTSELRHLVSERTGYPTEMLDPDLNIEADLGIDSIKRVEVLSAFQRRCSPEEQPRVQTVMDRLTSLKTLRDIAGVLGQALGSASQPALAAAASLEASAPADAPAKRDLTGDLVRIVSERTGYPIDMLDPDLNIEADLGIDSIKRVEILSTFQRRCSNEAQVRIQHAMERLTSQKTLRQLGATLADALSARTEPTRADFEISDGGEARSGPEIEEIPRFTLTAVDTPLEISRPQVLLPGRLWVITDDECGIAEAVATALTDRDERAVLLRHRPSTSILGASCYCADLTNPDQIAETIAHVCAAHGTPGALLHLLPLKPCADLDSLTTDAWRARVSADIKTLYSLIRAIGADLAKAGRPRGATVLAATALSGTLACGSPNGPPTHGGVAAFLKTLAVEMPDVSCRTVHLNSSESSEKLVAHLLAELKAADGPLECGYTGARRFTLAPQLTLLRGGGQLDLGRDSVFLITGGARGITAELAFHFATRVRPTLVLVGKSARPEVEAPETAAIEHPQQLRNVLMASMQAAGRRITPSEIEAALQRLLRDREIHRNLRALERINARFEYHQVDVRDASAFGALIDRVYSAYGRLDAVIHGAGIIEDKLVKDKTPDSFDRVVRTKTDSAFTLVRKLRPESLKLLLFMSSVAATFGNRGQADYGAANGVLNLMATTVAARWPARVLAVNWGPWDKTGMVSEEARRQFASRGIHVIPVAAGVAALEREIASGEGSDPVVVLGSGPWQRDAMAAQEMETPA
jgi:NAD(P)-dependent dehydrogenase (short-subunit alcohol dehydrogenase family)/acyl carrier protein